MSIGDMNKIYERFEKLEARIRELEAQVKAKANTLTLPKPKPKPQEVAHA